MASCLPTACVAFGVLVGRRQHERRRGQKRRAPQDVTPVAQIHSPIPDDLLPQLIELLPLLGLSVCLPVCKAWRQLLVQAGIWQSACRSIYPTIHWPEGDLWTWRQSLREIVTGEALLTSLRAIPDDKCSCGKPLTRFLVTREDRFQCDTCGIDEFPAGATVWGCQQCGLAKCSHCRHSHCHKVPTQRMCPKGHSLSQQTLMTSKLSCTCCGVPKRPMAAAPMWTCRACGCDLCGRCSSGRCSSDCRGSLPKYSVVPIATPMAISKGVRNYCDSGGWTALHHACRLGFSEVANELLNAKADVEAVDSRNGYTPLMVAATHGHAKLCSLLLARGACNETTNNYGRSAHDYAVRWSHVDLEELLG